MAETTPIVYCGECRILWGGRAAKPDCADRSHRHIDGEIHRHRSCVVLPDGSRVVAASFDPNDPYTREDPPNFGLYLDRQWSPPWDHAHLEWPDFGVPAEAAGLRRELEHLLDRSRRGERVEVGCLGGHGRTGTALACLAIIDGQPPASAVEWVRTNYCERAVETPEQEAFARAFRTV
jgi:hypothetical protein